MTHDAHCMFCTIRIGSGEAAEVGRPTMFCVGVALFTWVCERVRFLSPTQPADSAISVRVPRAPHLPFGYRHTFAVQQNERSLGHEETNALTVCETASFRETGRRCASPLPVACLSVIESPRQRVFFQSIY